MLVLTRKANESIVVGDGPRAVRVTVTRVEGGRVKLAIAAPRDVRVVRAELPPLPPPRRAA